MKYYGKFEHTGLLFNAYIDAESLKEAIDIALQLEYNFLYFFGYAL